MKKLLIKMLLLLPIPVVFFATTWIVDPANMKNDDSFETGVASILLSGKNVANLINYKERKLQQKIILNLAKAPEVIVLGSSRSMSIDSSVFSSKTFLNNSVSGASIEDYLGVFDLYRKGMFMPKLVVIGLDPWVLNRNNDQKRWVDLIAECTEMKSLLGFVSPEKVVDQGNFLTIIRNFKNKYGVFISPAYFNESFAYFIQKGFAGKEYWATEKSDVEVTVKKSDGSYVYDKKTREKNLADINRDANIFAKAKPIYSLGKFNELDNHTMQLLDGFINYLKKSDVTVLIFLPPYHPDVFEVIKANAAYSMVAESEKWYRSLASKYKLEVVGSYDPKACNLKDSDFYDGMHPKNEAVREMFIQKRYLNRLKY